MQSTTQAPLPGFTSAGSDVNDDGAVVGILQPFTGSVSKAFVWKSALTVLPGLGYAAEARAINSNGEIIGAAGDESRPADGCGLECGGRAQPPA